MRRGTQLVCVIVAVCLSWASTASADTVIGTVISVSPSTGRMIVKLRGKDTNRAVTVSKTARVVVNGKSGTLSRVKKGHTVYAIVSGSRVTRLNVKSEPLADTPQKPKPSTTPTGKTGTATSNSPTSRPPRSINITSRPSRTTPRSTTPPSDTASVTANPRTASNGEWPQFRGPNRDNKSTETGLLSSWSGEPELAWSARGLGEGYSSISIANGKVFTMGATPQGEAVIALDLATGRPVWSTPTGGQAFRDGNGNGPRGTPAVDGNKVYALGANGDLVCLDIDSGRRLWGGNILTQYQAPNIGWGISESLLIDGDNVICTPGGQRATMVAINKTSGRAAWTALVPTAPKAAYSSAVPVEVGGVRQYVNFTHNGTIGIRASDGAVMWGERSGSNGTANCSAPLFHDGHVFVSSDYGTGGALFRLTSNGGQTRSSQVYFNQEMKNHHGGMVVVDGFLYGTDGNILKCINLLTGRTAWRGRSVGKGAVTYADGHIVLRGENGGVALFEVSKREYVETGRFNQPQRSGRPAWAHPVIADGKLFLRDMDTLLAYNVKAN